MKISEAMRIGAATRPQVYGVYFDYSDNADGTTIMCSCAMGAVLEAVAGDNGIASYFENTLSIDDYRNTLGITSWSVRVEHPVNHGLRQLIDVIQSLNDEHKWQRERIADWLESIGY